MPKVIAVSRHSQAGPASRIEEARDVRPASPQKGALLLVVLCTGLIYVAYIAACVHPYGNNLSSLIVAGQYKYRTGQMDHHTVIFRNTTGFDGMLYYFVADDPFLQHPALHAQAFSHDGESWQALFHARIGYPLAVSAASLGRKAWRPAAMVGVNLVMVLVISWLAGMLVLLLGGGSRVWWALACALNPSLLVAVRMDLAEPMAIALALAGLLFYLRAQLTWAALTFAAALLTREVTLLFVLPVIATEVRARRLRASATLALALAPYLAAQVVLLRTFGRVGSIGGNYTLPFRGIASALAAGLRLSPRSAIIHQGPILLTAAIVCLALILSARQILFHYDAISGSLFLHAAAAVCASWSIWHDYSSAARVFGGLYILAILAFVHSRPPGSRALVGAILLLTLFTLLRPLGITPVNPYFLTP